MKELRSTRNPLGMLAHRIAEIFIDDITAETLDTDDATFKIAALIKEREGIDLAGDEDFTARVHLLVDALYTYIIEDYPARPWYEATRVVNEYADHVVDCYVALLQSPDTHPEIKEQFTARYCTATSEQSIFEQFVTRIFQQLWQFDATEDYVHGGVFNAVMDEQYRINFEEGTDSLWRSSRLHQLVQDMIQGTDDYPSPAATATVDDLFERARLIATESYDVWLLDDNNRNRFRAGSPAVEPEPAGA